MALVWRNVLILVFTDFVVAVSQIHGPAGCGKPETYPDKQLRDKYRQKLAFDNEERVFYTCAPGYMHSEGSRESKCESGRWTTLNMKCQKKKCNALGDIENGKYIREGQSFGDKAIAMCNKGYVLRGEKVRMCTEIGWNGTDPICEVSKIICSAPAVANGRIKPGERTQYAPQDTVNIVCSEGFDLIGSPQVTCGPDGQWQALPECRSKGLFPEVSISRVAMLKTCPTPNLGKNGTVKEQKSNYKPRESISVTCNEGFVGSGVFMCGATSKWHPKEPKCLMITCSAPTVANGRISPGSRVYRSRDTVDVICNEGFDLIGSPQVTCGPNGKWQALPKCRPKRISGKCGPAPLYPQAFPRDGSSTLKEYSSGARIHYKCSVGYVRTRGSSSIHCQNGQWTNLGLQCERKKCGSAGEISYGQFEYTGVSFGDSATAVCQEGYELIGPKVRICRDGGWDGRSPVCQPVHCPPPPEVKDAEMYDPIYDHVPFGHVLSYHCRTGALIGAREIYCTESGTWSAPPPECKVSKIICSAPAVANGRIKPGERTQYAPQDTVNIVCSEGFDLIGSPQVTCGPDSQWQALPECRPKVITCSAPTVANGRINPGSRVYRSRDTVDVICNEGFDLIGSPQITCGPDGQWQALPECRPKVITCSAPTVANGRINPGSRVYRSRDTVDVICNEGFDLIGSPQITCGPDSQWQALPECRPKVITCSAPTVANGRISPGSRVYRSRDTVDVICNEGFDLIGSPQVTCGPDGQWQALPKCGPKWISGKCGPAPLYAQAFPRDGSSTLKEYSSGARIHYKCSVGYVRTRGSSSIHCQNGQWTNLGLQCERKKCGSAGEISYGQFEYTGVSFGDSATAVCQEGYELIGPKVRICRDGGWDGRSPVCQPVHCPPPPEVKDAEMYDPIYDHVPFGHVLSYHCRTGALIGAREIYCTESGTWSAPPPECKDIVCPKPHVRGGSRIRGFRAVYKYGNTVTIICNPGLRLTGESFVTCGPDGLWNPKLPECVWRSAHGAMK